MKQCGNYTIILLLLTATLLLPGCGKPPTARLVCEGSTSMQKMMQEMADAYMAYHTHITVEYTGNGSSAGIKAVIAGTADLGAASRVVREEELNKGLQAIHIAWDAIAVIVHPSNAISGLTSEQVAKIYKKEITNWSEVGGLDSSIAVITRDPASGTRQAFEGLFGIKDEAQADQECAKTGETLTAVSQNPHAVGYISLSYIRDEVKALCIDGKEASEENVLSGTYEIRRPLMIVTKGDPDALEQDFIDFMFSEEGRAIIRREAIPIKKYE